jgi:hypothetical protein
MGLLAAADWGASQWIGSPLTTVEQPAPYLRKSFTATGKIRRALFRFGFWRHGKKKSWTGWRQ